MSKVEQAVQGTKHRQPSSSLRVLSHPAPQSLPTVSVIIPVGPGDEELVDGVLTSLCHQSYPSDRFEVVVVSSTPAKLELPDYPGMTVLAVQEERPGSYAARNTGVNSASGDVLAFTDADCVAHPDWLFQGVQPLRFNPSLIVGGPIQMFCRTAQPTLAEQYQMLFAFDQRANFRHRRGLPTANLFVRREVFHGVGPFEARLSSGGDSEWSRRALREGLEWHIESEALVYHPVRATWKEIKLQRRRYASAVSAERAGLAKLSWISRWANPLQLAGRIARATRRQLGARQILSLELVSIALGIYQASWGLRNLFVRSRQGEGSPTSEVAELPAGMPTLEPPDVHPDRSNRAGKAS